MASTCTYHTIWQKAVNMLQMAQNADENVTGTMAYFGVNLFFFIFFFFFLIILMTNAFKPSIQNGQGQILFQK